MFLGVCLDLNEYDDAIDMMLLFMMLLMMMEYYHK